MNQEILAQARRGIKILINENLSNIIIYSQASISDGFGGMTINPFGTSTPRNVRCRISSERVAEFTTSPSGFTNAINSFILVDFKTTITKDDTFEYLDKTWKIGIVETIKRFSGIVAYEAIMLEAE